MEENLRDKLVYIAGRTHMRIAGDLHNEFYKRFPNSWVSASIGKDSTYFFEDSEVRKCFEEMLREHNVPYSNVVPERKIERFADISFSGGAFENNSSMDGFIKGYKSVDDVIESDIKELKELGGSFNAIADRMGKIAKFGRNMKWPKYEDWTAKVDIALDEIKRDFGEDWDEIPEAIAKFYLMRNRILSRYPNFKLDNKVFVTSYVTTRGFQLCPFEGCQETWNDDAAIFNLATERELIVNSGTEHLVRKHHLLEKGNKYGITAREFYEHFMP